MRAPPTYSLRVPALPTLGRAHPLRPHWPPAPPRLRSLYRRRPRAVALFSALEPSDFPAGSDLPARSVLPAASASPPTSYVFWQPSCRDRALGVAPLAS